MIGRQEEGLHLHEVGYEEIMKEMDKWNNKIGHIEDNTDQLLRFKRQRGYMGLMDELPSKPLHIYLDYWTEKERIVPISIRIYHEERETIECFIYPVAQDLLNRIKGYYLKRNKRPYWVDFISDTTDNFVIALSAHFEKYDIGWIPTEDAVNYILQNRYVKLFTLYNHAEFVSKFYSCIVIHVYYCRSEDVYKADFLKNYHDIKIGSVEYNNMSQAVVSIKTKIEKVVKTYPNITDELMWKELIKYFK